MAILFCEDFKGYGDNISLMLNGLWGTTGMSLQADPDPNSDGGYVLRTSHQNDGMMRRPFAKGALDTFGCACRIWLDTLPGSSVALVRALDAGNDLQCCMIIDATGAIAIVFGTINHGGVVLGRTAVPVTTATAWHHYEFKVDTVGGHAEVRVDGVSVLKVDGNVGSAYQIGLGSTDNFNGYTAVSGFYKDLVVWDSSGNQNNDFLGTVSVVEQLPDSDVELGWTPSSGTTGYNLVNKAPPQDGTSYLTAPFPPPPPSEFTTSDLPPNVTKVYALMSQIRARKGDGGDGNVQTSLISSGTTVNGSDRPMTTAFTYYEDVFELDPHTGARWTPAAANNAQLEINRTQ